MYENKKQTKNLPGRPTSYKPEYCEMLIKHMSQGLSFESFGAVIGVHRATVFDWAKDGNELKYPGFSDAKKIAQDKCRLFWEKIGIGLATGREELKGGNPAIWIYNMKCRFPDRWKQRQELSVSSRLESDIKNLEQLTAEELAEKAKAAARFLENKKHEDIIDI